MAVIFRDMRTFKNAVLDIRSKIIKGRKNSKLFSDTLSVMEEKMNTRFRDLKFPPMFFVLETEKDLLFVCAGLIDMYGLHSIVYATLLALCFKKEEDGLLPDWNKTLLVGDLDYEAAPKEQKQTFTAKLMNTVRDLARKNKIKDVKSFFLKS